MFSYARLRCKAGHLSFLAGLLIDTMVKNSVFCLLSWFSYKAKLIVRLTGTVENIAAGKAVDRGKKTSRVPSKVRGCKVSLLVAMDSEDLYRALPTPRNNVEKSIRADMNVLHYEFKRGNLNALAWIPRQTNLPGPGAKPYSPVPEALQQTMFDKELCTDFSKTKQKALKWSLVEPVPNTKVNRNLQSFC